MNKARCPPPPSSPFKSSDNFLLCVFKLLSLNRTNKWLCQETKTSLLIKTRSKLGLKERIGRTEKLVFLNYHCFNQLSPGSERRTQLQQQLFLRSQHLSTREEDVRKKLQQLRLLLRRQQQQRYQQQQQNLFPMISTT